MKNKLKYIMICSCMLVLAACGNSSTKEATKAPKETTEQSTGDIAAMNKEGRSVFGEVTDYHNKVGNKVGTSGPLTVSVKTLHIYDVKTNAEGKKVFDKKDVAHVIAMDFTVKNGSKETINFQPDKAILTTDKGEKAEVSLKLSDIFEGNLIGNYEDSGTLIFQLNEEVKNLKHFTLTFDAPTKNKDKVGEDIKIDFKFKNK